MGKDYYIDWEILAAEQELRNLKMCLTPGQLAESKEIKKKNQNAKKK